MYGGMESEDKDSGGSSNVKDVSSSYLRPAQMASAGRCSSGTTRTPRPHSLHYSHPAPTRLLLSTAADFVTSCPVRQLLPPHQNPTRSTAICRAHKRQNLSYDRP